MTDPNSATQIAPPPEPIVVNSDPTMTILPASLGQLVPVLGGFVAAYAHLSKADGVAVVAGLLILANYAWRMLAAASSHRKLVIAATYAPNNIAQVK